MFTIRRAVTSDIPALEDLIARSGIELSTGFYTDEQAEVVTRQVFGVDSQMIADGSYFAVEGGSAIVACGGWSKRSTSYGGDKAKTEPERLLDPASEPARIRAFFVDPGMARRGLGSMLMNHCIGQAAAGGFTSLELVSTLPGEPLYRAFGFMPVERFDLQLEVLVPVIRMRKTL